MLPAVGDRCNPCVPLPWFSLLALSAGSTGVMSFFLNFTFVSGISLFAASEIFRKGVKNAVNMGRNARFELAL